MNIAGLDIGRGSSVAVILSCFPTNIQQYFKKHRQEFIKLETSNKGVDKLLSLKPDAIVLEPSGHWYSHFWYKVALANNLEVCWVGHGDLAAQRSSYGFSNKRDDEDALCLAATYFDERFINEHGNKRFLNYYKFEINSQLREFFLEKEQLAKHRTFLVNQLRQRLSYEFPEISRKQFSISKIRQHTPIIGWLALLNNDLRYRNLWNCSVSRTINIVISEYTRQHSKAIVTVENRLCEQYDLIEQTIDNPEFTLYNRVFDKFGFGLDNRALLLYHIYPFDKFLVNGKPYIEFEESQGKLQKRDRSLRKFQAYLGMTYKIKQSGDKNSKSFSGSTMVRSHLYMWVVCQITPRKNGYKVNTDTGRKLTDYYLKLKEEKRINGKDGITRVLFKATRMLFYELRNTFC